MNNQSVCGICRARPPDVCLRCAGETSANRTAAIRAEKDRVAAALAEAKQLIALQASQLEERDAEIVTLLWRIDALEAGEARTEGAT